MKESPQNLYRFEDPNSYIETVETIEKQLLQLNYKDAILDLERITNTIYSKNNINNPEFNLGDLEQWVRSYDLIRKAVRLIEEMDDLGSNELKNTKSEAELKTKIDLKKAREEKLQLMKYDILKAEKENMYVNDAVIFLKEIKDNYIDVTTVLGEIKNKYSSIKPYKKVSQFFTGLDIVEFTKNDFEQSDKYLSLIQELNDHNVEFSKKNNLTKDIFLRACDHKVNKGLIAKILNLLNKIQNERGKIRSEHQ